MIKKEKNSAKLLACQSPWLECDKQQKAMSFSLGFLINFGLLSSLTFTVILQHIKAYVSYDTNPQNISHSEK